MVRVGDVVLLLIIGPFVLVSATSLFHGLASLVVGAHIRRAETDSVQVAMDGGHVHLEGVAREHDETLQSPVTGQECLGYRYELKDVNTDDGSSKSVDDGGRVVPFFLETDGGTVLVDGENPTLAFTGDVHSVTIDSRSATPAPVQRFVERHDEVDPVEGTTVDLKLTELETVERYDIVEFLLLPGEESYVSGVGRSPTAASQRVPMGATAVVTDPSPEGIIGGLTERLWPASFMISDSPREDAAETYLIKGGVYTTLGLVILGIPVYLLLQFF